MSPFLQSSSRNNPRQIGVSSRIDARASRRNDTLEGPGSVGDLLPDPVAPVTVTETVRQTVTVNGGDAAEGFNATATETVTMTILADDGLLDDQAFEGYVSATSRIGAELTTPASGYPSPPPLYELGVLPRR